MLGLEDGRGKEVGCEVVPRCKEMVCKMEVFKMAPGDLIAAGLGTTLYR
jgi:hypothetical protein